MAGGAALRAAMSQGSASPLCPTPLPAHGHRLATSRQGKSAAAVSSRLYLETIMSKTLRTVAVIAGAVAVVAATGGAALGAFAGSGALGGITGASITASALTSVPSYRSAAGDAKPLGSRKLHK